MPARHRFVFHPAFLAFFIQAGFLGWLFPLTGSAQSLVLAGAQAGAAVNFGAVNVCPAGQAAPAPCATTISLLYNVVASQTLGTPQVLTTGAPGLDFTLAGGGTCVGAVAAGNTCAVNVTFAPLGAGLRAGAVELLDTNGNVLANTYIYGTGSAPVAAFSPASEITVGSGFSLPSGIAVDSSGDIFVADTNNSAVKEILAAGGYTTVRTLGSGFNKPLAVAVDGGGNVFVTDSASNSAGVVKEIAAAGGYTTVNIVTSQIADPAGLAVDASGDLFVTDPYNSLVEEVVAAGGYLTVLSLGSGFNSPQGVAVDPAGNVYVADSGNNAVKQILAAGGYVTVNTLAGSYSNPLSVALDAAGDIYVADSGNTAVQEIPAAGGYAGVVTVAGGFGLPAGVALDSSGNIYVADSSSNAVDILQNATPSPLSFAATNLGGTSSDSPRSVTVRNVGNSPFAATGLSLSDTIDFAQIFNTSTIADCSATTLLTPGGACALAISFTPYSGGLLSGSMTLTDNALNVNAATQAIQLSGIGSGVSQSITFTPIPSQNGGTVLNLVPYATASSGLAVSFASQTPGICAVAAGVASLLAAGNCTIAASQAGNAEYLAAAPVSQTISVHHGTQTIVFNTIASQSVGSSIPLTATASSGLAVSFATTTSPVCTVSGNIATLIGTGTCTVQATQSGNAAYFSASAVTRSFKVNPLHQSITFPTIPTQYVGASVTLVATASSGLPVNFVTTTPAVCTVSGNIATLIGAGGCMVQAFQAGNAQYLNAGPYSSAFIVRQLTQTVVFNSIATQYAGTSVTLVATTTSNLPITFATTTPAVCTVSGNTAALIGAGVCTVQASQAGNAAYAAAGPYSHSFTVKMSSQTVTFGPIAAQYAGIPLTLAATASSGLTVAFTSSTPAVCTVSGNVATLLTAGSCTIQASQSGNAAYSAAAQVTQSFTVNPQSQTIAFSPIAAQYVGATVPIIAAATSGLPVSFASLAPSVCTVSGNVAALLAAGTCSIQGSQSGSAVYLGATALASFTVNALPVGPLVGNIIGDSIDYCEGATSTATCGAWNILEGLGIPAASIVSHAHGGAGMEEIANQQLNSMTVTGRTVTIVDGCQNCGNMSANAAEFQTEEQAMVALLVDAAVVDPSKVTSGFPQKQFANTAAVTGTATASTDYPTRGSTCGSATCTFTWSNVPGQYIYVYVEVTTAGSYNPAVSVDGTTYTGNWSTGSSLIGFVEPVNKVSHGPWPIEIVLPQGSSATHSVSVTVPNTQTVIQVIGTSGSAPLGGPYIVVDNEFLWYNDTNVARTTGNNSAWTEAFQEVGPSGITPIYVNLVPAINGGTALGATFTGVTTAPDLAFTVTNGSLAAIGIVPSAIGGGGGGGACSGTPTIKFFGGGAGATLPTATLTCSGGKVTGATITSPGSGITLPQQFDTQLLHPNNAGYAAITQAALAQIGTSIR